MSSKIDERIVGMKFNNSQFEKGVADTSKSLDKLKQALNLQGSAKGFDDVNAAANRVSLAGISDGVQTLAGKFTAMSVIAISALATIASKAVDTGLTLVKSLTVDPIKSGLEEYETQLNSVQTILANTQSKGSTLADVNAALQELNTYADLTIYNFAEMARNIGTFTAAGVDLETSASAIKGIANLAALSGSNSQQASTAMYQLSQALASGTVKLMDWNSVVNAGMGGQVFQDALKETARNHGIAVDEMIDKNGSFRESLQEGWLTSEVMTETLAKLTGDLTDEQLRSMGYTNEQIVGIQEMARTASDAATKVKTVSQLIGTLQEATQSGWAQSWQIIFGDFEEAKELFTSVNDVLGAMIGQSADARNKLLQDWKDAGGRTAAIDSVKNAFTAVMAVIKPLKEAFQDIFPPMTGQQLANITEGFKKFTESLIPGTRTINELRRVFRGVFAVFDIGRMFIGEIIGLFGRLFGAATEGAGGVLTFSAKIGDWLVNVRDAIKEGSLFANFFDKIGDFIEGGIDSLRRFGQATIDFIDLDGWADLWNKVGDAIQWVADKLAPVADWVKEAFATIKQAFKDAFSAMDPSLVVGSLNAGLLAGIGGTLIVLIKKIPKMLEGILGNVGGGVIDTIKGAFSSLTDTMEAMQAKLKADTLIKIATAIGILTAAVVLLSFIEVGRLYASLGAIAAMMVLLSGTMVAIEKLTASKGFAKMPFLAGAMIGMATAMVIFSAAVAIMAGLSWEELAKGMAGMATGLTILTVALTVLSKIAPKLSGVGGMLILVATSMVILGAAMKIFASLSWEDIGKGATVLVALSGALVIFSKSAGALKGAATIGVGILLIATAMTVLGGAMKIMASMSWEEIAKGLVAMAGGLLIITAAIYAMPGDARLLMSATGLVIISGALTILAGAMKIFGSMSWDEIGRGLVVLGGSLAILAGAMALMGIPIVMMGSIGILAASAALMMLAPAMAILGTMSWDDIGRGLTVLGGALAIMAVGGILLIPALPGLLGLGAASVLIGAGALAAGIGMTAFATGFSILASGAAANSAQIRDAILILIGLIPTAMAAFAQGIIDFALVIANGGVEFTAAMTTLLQSLIDSTNTMAPQIIDTLWNLVVLMTEKIVAGVPYFVDAGMRLMIGFLNAVNRRIPELANSATNVIITFINAIGASAARIADAGYNMIINFINSLANTIRSNQSKMESAGRNLADAIIDGMVGGIGRGISSVVNAAKKMAERALNAAKDFLGIHSPSREFDALGVWSTKGMANGLIRSADIAAKAGSYVGKTTINSVRDTIAKVKDQVAMDMSMTPTIRPVLDLSAIRKDAGGIGDLIKPPSLKLDNNYAQAASLAVATRANEESAGSEDDDDRPTGGNSYTFNQYNTSPKALSNAEIYRQSKNQMSVIKREVPV